MLLVLTVAIAGSSLWDGDFYDPDDLKITLKRSGGDELLAHSDDWDITGTVIGDTKAHLAGLEGTLSREAVTWSNGVVWTRHSLPTLLPPPTWAGEYRNKQGNIEVALSLPSPSTARAESDFFTAPAMGSVSGDTIHMFGVLGKLRAGYALDGGINNVIDWSNGEVWTKMVSQGPTEHLPAAKPRSWPPPPPPLLAAGTPGAGPDYWAADFAAAAHRPAGEKAPVKPPVKPQAAAFAVDTRAAAAGSSGAASSILGTSMYSHAAGVSSADVYSYEQGALEPSPRADVTADARSTRGGGGGAGTPLLLLLLISGGAFAAHSYRRHGVLQNQLLRDDAREVLRRARELLSNLRRRSRELSQHGAYASAVTTEESADRHEDAKDAKELLGGGWLLLWGTLGSLKTRLPAVCTEGLAALTAAYGAREVASASDGIGTEIKAEIQFGDFEDTDGCSPREVELDEFGGSTRLPGFCKDRLRTSSLEKPVSYAWEGEKLSWEDGPVSGPGAAGRGVEPASDYASHQSARPTYAYVDAEHGEAC